MPNYGLFTNFVFCKSSFKKERFPIRKKRKTAIAAVSVTIDFLGCDKHLSKWRENCVTKIFFVSQQYFLCHNTRSKNWQMSYVATKDSKSRQEMGRSQLRERSVMLRHNEIS